MKRAIISALFAAGVVGVASADIQAPPASEYTPTRKLGRAIANLIYSVEEIPLGIINWTSREGDYAGFSVGIVDGTATMFERMGYGIYELVTFWAPTYKCAYKPPYQGRCGMSGLKEYNPNGGLSEFPAELSFQSYYKYSRQQHPSPPAVKISKGLSANKRTALFSYSGLDNSRH